MSDTPSQPRIKSPAPHRNANTLFAGTTRQPAKPNFERVFRQHYHAFSSRLRATSEPGVAVVAIDNRSNRFAGFGYVAARIGASSAMVVGRHSHVDLVLEHPEASLRQFAIIVEPLSELLRPGSGVTFRIVDLRSTAGFRIETGVTLTGLCADGPTFIESSGYSLFLFVTGDPTDWPESPSQAWSYIPERVYLRERKALSSSGKKTKLTTLVRAAQSPLAVGTLGFMPSMQGEKFVGELTLVGDGRTVRRLVSVTSLARGILIGRAERCDSRVGGDKLSRVHLLIISIEGKNYVLDTASTFGSQLGGYRSKFQLAELPAAQTIVLANSVSVHWVKRD